MQQNHDFAHAYAQLSSSIYRYAYYRLGSRELAEDVTAETFARLLENPKSQEAQNLRAWTLAIARNIILNMYKQKQSLSFSDEGEELLVADNLESKQLTSELLGIIRAELKNLDPEAREIIILKTWEELKFEEIAEVIGLNINNVKAKYYRGIDDLKMRLNTEDKDKKARSVALPVILLGIAQMAKSSVLAPSPEFLGKLWENIGAEFSNLNINYQDMRKNTLKQLLKRKLFIAAAIMTVVIVGGITGVTLLLANNNQLPVVQPENRQPNNNLPTEPVLVPEKPEAASWETVSFVWGDRTIKVTVPEGTIIEDERGYGGGKSREIHNEEFKMSFSVANDPQLYHVDESEYVGTAKAWRELYFATEHYVDATGMAYDITGYTDRVSNDVAYCNQMMGIGSSVAVPCAFMTEVDCRPVTEAQMVTPDERKICDQVIQSLEVTSGEKLGGMAIFIGIPAQGLGMRVAVYPGKSASISPVGNLSEYVTLTDTGYVMGFQYPRDAAPMQFSEQVDIAGSTIPGLKRVRVVGQDQTVWWYTTSGETALINTADGMMQVTCKADNATALAECDEVAKTMHTSSL